jgi:peptidoglycan/LPS O-acetylase OafA/YrhL
MNDQPKRYEELDALRGVAALMVLSFHFTIGRPIADIGFGMGYTGVDLFFLISGFVIFMSLDKTKKSSDFVISRVSRLYPAYWASVSFTFLLVVTHSFYKNGGINNHLLQQYAGNLTMFQYYLNIPDLDGPYWTMIVEMLFYIVMLLLFRFKLLRFLNILGLVFSITIASITYFFGDCSIVNDIIWWIPVAQFIPLFFAGTVFYKMYTGIKKTAAQYAIVFTCFICQVVLLQYLSRTRPFINQAGYAVMLTIFFSLFILFVNGKLKFIVSRATLFLGKISFPLYLTHNWLCMGVLIPMLTNKLHIPYWIASLFIALPAAIFVAYCINRFIEVPGTPKMKGKLNTLFPVKTTA